MNERLKSLYQNVILQHNKTPYHFEQQAAAAQTIEANNPRCGDRFQLYLDWEDNRIKTAYFHGFGCAISKASTSILTQKLEGCTWVEAQALCQHFLQFIEGENRAAVQEEAIEAFAAVEEFPARKDCAVLVWKALNEYLSKEEEL